MLPNSSTSALTVGQCLEYLKLAYPRAHFLGCSTAGEIAGTVVHDGTVIATIIVSSTPGCAARARWLPEAPAASVIEKPTETIKRTEAETGRHLPLVPDTANPLPGNREHCLSAGMDAYT